jgi:hypothetical protein
MKTDMRTPNVALALDPILNRLRKVPPARRVAMGKAIYQQLTDYQSLIANENRGAVREMREQGQTLGEIAAQLGVSISRVKQMEDTPNKAKPTPEQQVAKLQRQLERAQAEAKAS